MSKAQTDIRTTSYDVWTANPVGYIGTVEDALAQIRQDVDIPPTIKAREELLQFLGVNKNAFSGVEVHTSGQLARHLARDAFMARVEDDSVVYGAPEAPKQPWEGLSIYTLEYAMKRWPQCFKH